MSFHRRRLDRGLFFTTLPNFISVFDKRSRSLKDELIGARKRSKVKVALINARM